MDWWDDSDFAVKTTWIRVYKKGGNMKLIERETCDLYYHMKSLLQRYSSYIQNRTLPSIKW